MSEEPETETLPVVEPVDKNIATPDLPTKEEFEAMTDDQKVEMAKKMNHDRAEALRKLAATMVMNKNIGTLAMAITKVEALLRISVTLHQIGYMDEGDPDEVYALFPPTLRGQSIVDANERIARKEKGQFSNRERHFLKTAYEVYKIRKKNAAIQKEATDVLDEASIAEESDVTAEMDGSSNR